jgi:DNA-binding response OmpR family regulator
MASTDQGKTSDPPEGVARVLVIGHEDEERQSISDIVKQEDHDAVTASTGEEALKHVREGHVRLILADMTIPDMNGWQLLETIKGEKPDIKAIVLTTVVPEDEGTSRLGEMADGYLAKPVDPERVRASLKAFLLPGGLGRLAEVLLVDHNPDTRTVIAGALRERGFSVALSEDPQEGFRQIQRSRPDLCIVRLVFLGESGLGFCQLLRSDPEYHDLPITLIAEKPSRDDVLKAAELGVSEFIVEPIDPKELGDRVIQMIP